MATRAEHKADTRAALAQAAVDLFTEHGYEAVTMADVAGRAGVSRRTAFRYFSTKEDLVMEYPMSWLRVFDEAVADHAELPIAPRLRAASHAIADHIESDPQPVKQAFAVAFSHPALAGRYASVSHRWIDRVTQEIIGDTETAPADAVRARILGSAVMGMIDAVCEQWAASDEPMSPLIDRGFDLLDPAFDA